MQRFWTSFVFVLMLTLVVTLPASAHTPIGAGHNDSLASATLIPDSTKSWAVYTELHETGHAQYYRFDATQGERIPIMLYTSPSPQEADFAPNFVLTGPGISSQGTVPGFVESPTATVGHLVVEGRRPAQATYEPFAPSTFAQVADLSFVAPANGTYYLAVYNQARGGRYGVAIGEREATNLYEWIVNPLAFPYIYIWEGQSPFLVFTPAFSVLAFGFGLLGRRQGGPGRLGLAGWLAALAGLLFIGSGATVASQMVVAALQSSADSAVIVTFVIAAIPIMLGVFGLRLALRNAGPATWQWRVSLALLGVGALIFWAGWLVGPGLAFTAALWPAPPGSNPNTA
jgi:hypothetical protein